MSKTIWKIQLEGYDVQTGQLPSDFKPIHVGVQIIPPEPKKIELLGDSKPDEPQIGLMVWGECTPGKPEVSVKFRLVGTGTPVPTEPGWSHCGTIVLGPAEVIHVYWCSREGDHHGS